VWILALVSVTATLVVARAEPAAAADAITVSPGYTTAFPFDAPDPDVVYAGGRYYAYTTGSWWGNYIGILTSDTPQGPWHPLPGVPVSSAFRPVDLTRAPASWQVNHTQLAPGVFRWNGRWIMYYTAQKKTTHQWCLSIATASSPAGPFKDISGSKPWFCADALGGVVDPSPFVDNDGRAYLYFKSNTGTVWAPARLWAVQLDSTGLKMKTIPRVVLTQRTDLYPWETTIENPEMIVRHGVRYLLFSGNQWDSPNYAEGYAVCSGPLGPCRRALPTPFLQRYGTVHGPGGASAFTDANGAWWIAYHAWKEGCTKYSCGGARRMYVQPLHFAGMQVPCSPPADLAGYRLAAADGGVFRYGHAPFCGSAAGIRISGRVVGIARTASNGGYWLVTDTGAVYAFGNARFVGSTGGKVPSPIIAIAPAPDGNGYWLGAQNGSVYAYGSARFYGSAGNKKLNQPIVGMTAAPDGKGYWLVARDGGIFSYGSARFYGSTGAIRLNQPIVGMAAGPAGKGYWLVARDGGIFSFGTARFYGSTGSMRLNQPIVGMGPTADGKGYRIVASDGGIFSFGNARFYGSAGSLRLRSPIVGMS
jgi:hypothetical protein